MIISKNEHAGGGLGGQGSPCPGNTHLGLDGPTIGADIDQPGRVVLSSGRGYREAHANNGVLLVIGELFHRLGGSAVEIHVNTKQGIGKTGDLPFL